MTGTLLLCIIVAVLVFAWYLRKARDADAAAADAKAQPPTVLAAFDQVRCYGWGKANLRDRSSGKTQPYPAGECSSCNGKGGWQTTTVADGDDWTVCGRCEGWGQYHMKPAQDDRCRACGARGAIGPVSVRRTLWRRH